MVKVLVGILSVGESQEARCLQAIRRQKYVSVDYFKIHNLPNKLAHSTLYKRFMKESLNYDFMFKIDADMILLSNTTLFHSLEYFTENIDHCVFPLHDFFTNTSIYGLHAFRTGCIWPVTNDSMFVDKDPIYNGRKLVVEDLILASHGWEATAEECFSFGYHRATKVLQRGRFRKNYFQAGSQLVHLEKCFDIAEASSFTDVRTYVLRGALASFKGGGRYVSRDNIRIKFEKAGIERDSCFITIFNHGSSLNRLLRFMYVVIPKIAYNLVK